MAETSAKTDVAVVGGGPAGLVAAIALARMGLSVHAFAPVPPADQRTTALLRGSVALLQAMDIWPRIEPYAAPLSIMRMIDDTGRLLRAPTVEFDSRELGGGPFGYNIRNSDLVRELETFAASLPALTLDRRMVERVVPDEDIVDVWPAGGDVLRVRLVVGADGLKSRCRAAAEISMKDHRYDQTALAFNVTHTLPHNDTSTEFHTKTGPFTLVPLPGLSESGGHQSSIVWVVRPDEATRLLALSDEAIVRDIERRAYGILGAVTGVGPRGAFPLAQIVASHMARRRIALVGESGHVLPPIGAQGLNLGFRDAATLAEIVEDAVRDGHDIGAPRTLAAYDRRRRADVATRAAAIDLLNRSVLSGLLPFQVARGAGLFAAKHFYPVRNLLMKLGMEPIGDVPRLMKKAG